MTILVNTEELEAKVKDMYRHVAQQPRRPVPLRARRRRSLSAPGTTPTGSPTCPPGRWSPSPGWATSSTWPTCRAGETVVDLGSGSGMDAFYAAGLVGPTGHVYGVDFTREQLDKARRLATEAGLAQVEFREARIEALPLGRCQRRLRDLQRRDQPVPRQAGSVRRGSPRPASPAGAWRSPTSSASSR